MEHPYPARLQRRIVATEAAIERAEACILRSERLLAEAEQLLRRASKRRVDRPQG